MVDLHSALNAARCHEFVHVHVTATAWARPLRPAAARTVDRNRVDALHEQVLVHHVDVTRALRKHEHWRRRLLQALADARELVLRLHVLDLLRASFE
jgi:hypothetical protein